MGIILASLLRYAWFKATKITEQYYALSSRSIGEHYRSTKLALRTFVASIFGDPQDYELPLPTTYPNNLIGSESTPLSHEDGHAAELSFLDPNPWIL